MRDERTAESGLQRADHLRRDLVAIEHWDTGTLGDARGRTIHVEPFAIRRHAPVFKNDAVFLEAPYAAQAHDVPDGSQFLELCPRNDGSVIHRWLGHPI